MSKVRYLKLLVLAVCVGVVVALTYLLFERSVHLSINYIWEDLLSTDSRRPLVVPLCVLLSVLYFGLQHWLDPDSEKTEAHGLGAMPKVTVANYGKILLIGFFSLVAGASLGPEAVLVPACIVAGAYLGAKLLPKDKPLQREAAALGFVALFTAFFNSFAIGMLSLLLVKKELKLPLSARFALFSAVSAGVVAGILKLLEGSAYVSLPQFSWQIDLRTVIALCILCVAGFLATNVLKLAHTAGLRVKQITGLNNWWSRALLAALVLSVLYLLGGPLVQFTGNESIAPMLHQSKELGLAGLLGVALLKLVAIAWSKAAGYRGGLIFPSLFVACTLVAAVEVSLGSVNFIYALVATLVGLFAADKKAKILL